MRADTDNDWSNRTTAGYLRRLMEIYFADPEADDIPDLTVQTEEFPKTMESCMQMLYERVHSSAANGYSSYYHVWETDNLSKEYTLEDVVDLGKEIFIDCEIYLEESDVLSCTSSSSNPPVVDTQYEIVIDWKEEESAEELERKWNKYKDRCGEYSKKDGEY